MSKSQSKSNVTDGGQADKLTTGDDREPNLDLRGASMVLYKAGEQLDDPDPARVARWIVRLREEGEL